MKFKPLQEYVTALYMRSGGRIRKKKEIINSLILAAVWKDSADMFPCSGK